MPAMRLPNSLRALIVILLALIPLSTLLHQDDLGRWDTQRSAMAAPDEFSYLLMARHFLAGGGLSLQADLGRDTFYPPGYPLLLAAWSKPLGLSVFSAHALNTALLSLATVAVYFLARRILLHLFSAGHRRFALSDDAAAFFALLITALFATNWHVLETSLLIMSEPAFMVVSFAWLTLALRWRAWRMERVGQAILARKAQRLQQGLVATLSAPVIPSPPRSADLPSTPPPTASVPSREDVATATATVNSSPEAPIRGWTTAAKIAACRATRWGAGVRSAVTRPILGGRIGRPSSRGGWR